MSMEKKNGKIKVDDKNKRLVMDRKFDLARRTVDSNEYNLLRRAMADYPKYNVVVKHIKTNPEKRVYKHLTYEYMREYIERHDNRDARIIEFEEMILRSKCHLVKYPKVKEWFLAAYPDIDDFTPQQYIEECGAQNMTDNYEVVIEADESA